MHSYSKPVEPPNLNKRHAVTPSGQFVSFDRFLRRSCACSIIWVVPWRAHLRRNPRPWIRTILERIEAEACFSWREDYCQTLFARKNCCCSSSGCCWSRKLTETLWSSLVAACYAVAIATSTSIKLRRFASGLDRLYPWPGMTMRWIDYLQMSVIGQITIGSSSDCTSPRAVLSRPRRLDEKPIRISHGRCECRAKGVDRVAPVLYWAIAAFWNSYASVESEIYDGFDSWAIWILLSTTSVPLLNYY